MNQKVTLAVSAALMSMSLNAAEQLGSAVQGNAQDQVILAASPISVNKNVNANVQARKKQFQIEKDLAPGDYIYIVQLANPSVALYDGGIEGYPATNPRVRSTVLGERVKQAKLDLESAEVKRYAQLIETKQQEVLSSARQKLGNLDVLKQYKYAINGFSVKMSQEEAMQLSNVPGVLSVERDQIYQLNTDVGPTLIGAPDVWEGTATGGVGTLGEGVIVGIFDTGVNTDHPSFADVGGDGYDHTNPYGDGVYVGDCAGDFPELCNDKLIGVRSYPSITGVYSDETVFPPGLPENGEDYNGHGSHTAGTAAGNVLFDVPLHVPDVGQEEGDGTPTSVVFEHMSGVAPHANIISYGVCQPGNRGDTYAGCTGAAILGAQEDAIADGIDVVNHSIGPGPGQNLAWTNASEVGFLSMRNAGIFVATSAGNDGPDAGTTSKQAPWYTAVAASTHGRTIDTSKEMRDFTGGDTELGTITGSSNSGGITASIVYAGDFENPNDPDNDPAQCLQPFPEGTFSGEIVVCDRGSIARVQKAINVADGGAGGYVLANVEGGSDTVNSDFYVVPGIHVNAEQSTALRAWLASGEGHTATITPADAVVSVDDSAADRVIGFSSRGPNLTISALSPWVAAPGVNIYAATNDQDYGKDVNTPAPSDYDFLSGTSMASPHVAGAAALLTGLYPDWTPDQIRSALMMTSTTAMLDDNDDTATDWFDMGAGRIQVDQAANAGLVMDETAANYQSANPNDGGDPRTLNLPSITDNACVGTCTWTRTVTATQAGTWSVSGATISPGLVISASPETFTLAAGESQEISVTVDAFSAQSDVWSFGIVNMTSDSSPDLHWPVSVVASNGNLPDSFAFEANRNQDSYLVTDLMALEISALQSASMMVPASLTEAELLQDSANGSILDDLTDGLSITEVTVPEGAMRMVAEITETTSSDLDLFVIFDANADGIPTEDEIVASSASATAFERVDVMSPDAGFYWVVVQNWAASVEGEADTFTLSYATVADGATDMVVIDAPSAVPQLTEFDIRFAWNLEGAVEDDRFYGVVTMGTDAENPTNLGAFPMDITRGADDVSLVTEQEERVNPGDSVDYAVSVNANFSPEDRTYEITMAVPDGFTLDSDSLGENAEVDADSGDITWTLTQPSLLGATPTYSITSNATDAMCVNPNFGANNSGYIDLSEFGVGPAGLTGDTVTATYGLNALFLGELYNSFTVTDDGFITINSSDVGGSPWVNQLMPDDAAPNAVAAPFWRDLIFDESIGSALYVATAGAGFTIVEWDNMRFPGEFYGGLESNDIIDFQITFINDPAPGAPNLVYGYNNVTHDLGMGLPVSIGYEDATGTVGATPYFSGAAGSAGDITTDIVDGRLICMYLQAVPDEPTQLPFTLTANEDFVGGAIQLVVMSDLTSSEFAAAVASEVEASVQVEGAPIVTIDGMASAELTITELQTLTLPGAVVEPNGDSFDITWRQVSGPAAVIAGNGLAEAQLMAPEVDEDSTIELVLEAEDENGNASQATVTVTVANNLAPSLSVTAPRSVSEGDSIVVSATATDPEGDALTYTINGAPGNSFSSVAPGTDSQTTVSFVVTVTDGLNMVSETVTVTVTDKSGGSIGWIALLLVPLAFVRRRMTK